MARKLLVPTKPKKEPKENANDQKLTCRLPSELFDFLRDIAEEKGKTISQYLRDMLTKHKNNVNKFK